LGHGLTLVQAVHWINQHSTEKIPRGIEHVFERAPGVGSGICGNICRTFQNGAYDETISFTQRSNPETKRRLSFCTTIMQFILGLLWDRSRRRCLAVLPWE
jgi:hypothetical protein